MNKYQKFLYKSRFSYRELQRLEERSGLRISHVRLFMEMILNEATEHDYIVRASQMGVTFGIVTGP